MTGERREGERGKRVSGEKRETRGWREAEKKGGMRGDRRMERKGERREERGESEVGEKVIISGWRITSGKMEDIRIHKPKNMLN